MKNLKEKRKVEESWGLYSVIGWSSRLLSNHKCDSSSIQMEKYTIYEREAYNSRWNIYETVFNSSGALNFRC